MKPHILLSVFSLLWVSLSCQRLEQTENYFITGVRDPIISLNGIWYFTMNPCKGFWKDSVDFSGWSTVKVPGELAMQGYPIKHDSSFVYKTSFQIPEDFRNKVIKLRFDGVYSFARIWINGIFITEHTGGFTRWECDITDEVDPGDQAILTVQVRDLRNDVSYGSGYAKHQIGGILRDVNLLALPPVHFESFYLETDLDENYRDAVLTIFSEVSQKEDCTVELELYDQQMKEVPISTDRFSAETYPIKVIVDNPIKWSAEKPVLYSLMVTLKKEEEILQSFSKKIGFREVEIIGNKMLVNGKPVKLRGACRHDIHPLLGRMTLREQDLQDVMLAKEANINFIRTSHYPCSESFLDFCDQYGIYIEVESAVCFVNTYRTADYDTVKHAGPVFESIMLNQLQEMVSQHRNHPSVIIWSTGNESRYDKNFQISYDWLKREDPTRPVIFSFPGTKPDSASCYDILSIHYPTYQGFREEYGITVNDFNNEGMPVLFDEWAHVPCYNQTTLAREVNVRDFWGISLDSMWTKLFEAEGGLGGAIWGFIDETFALPEEQEGFGVWWGKQHPFQNPLSYHGPVVGYGEWGIIDVWRRKKPEFWNVKKAYSPVRILEKKILRFEPREPLRIPIHNRFDHTNLKDITVAYEYRGQTGELQGPDLEPHTKGEIIIPAYEWIEGESLRLNFYDFNQQMIDAYNLQLGSKDPASKKGTDAEAQMSFTETETEYLIKWGDLIYSFDRKQGLFNHIRLKEDTLIFGGPDLILKTQGEPIVHSVSATRKYESNWTVDQVRMISRKNGVRIEFNKHLDEIRLHTAISIIGDRLEIFYQLDKIPEENIRELGMKFLVSPEFERLAWKKEGYWTFYPEDHMNTLYGDLPIRHQTEYSYRKSPDQLWHNDIVDFYYKGISHSSYKYQVPKTIYSYKNNIESYNLEYSGNEIDLQVTGARETGCRISQDQNGFLELHIVNRLNYPDISWGNYHRSIRIPDFTGSFTLSLISNESR